MAHPRAWPTLLLLALVALSACRTNIYEGYDSRRDEWSIRGTSPGGMYGGFIGLAPSPEVVRAEAARICPGGYDTISEEARPFFEGKLFELRMRCRPPSSGREESNGAQESRLQLGTAAGIK
jgi:hypothetical protein